jgi:hypothetical protein
MRRYRTLGAAVGSLVLAAVLALGADVAPAWAGDVRILIGGGGWHAGQHHPQVHHQGHFKHFHPGHGHRFHHPGPGHHGQVILVPSYPHVVAPRWVPGYWTYRWVAHAVPSYVWVPGSYTVGGYGVEGRYEPRTSQAGYYQQVWIEGYWAR